MFSLGPSQIAYLTLYTINSVRPHVFPPPLGFLLYLSSYHCNKFMQFGRHEVTTSIVDILSILGDEGAVLRENFGHNWSKSYCF